MMFIADTRLAAEGTYGHVMELQAAVRGIFVMYSWDIRKNGESWFLTMDGLCDCGFLTEEKLRAIFCQRNDLVLEFSAYCNSKNRDWYIFNKHGNVTFTEEDMLMIDMEDVDDTWGEYDFSDPVRNADFFHQIIEPKLGSIASGEGAITCANFLECYESRMDRFMIRRKRVWFLIEKNEENYFLDEYFEDYDAVISFEEKDIGRGVCLVYEYDRDRAEEEGWVVMDLEVKVHIHEYPAPLRHLFVMTYSTTKNGITKEFPTPFHSFRWSIIKDHISEMLYDFRYE